MSVLAVLNLLFFLFPQPSVHRPFAGCRHRPLTYWYFGHISANLCRILLLLKAKLVYSIDATSHLASHHLVSPYLMKTIWLATFQLVSKVYFKWRGSPSGVYSKWRDSPFGVLFKRRECSSGLHFKQRDCSSVYPLPNWLIKRF